MDRAGFKSHLQARGLKPRSIDTYLADANRVDAAYGDLDEQYAEDQLAGLLEMLTQEARQGSSSRMQITGDARRALASYKTAVNRYREYRHAHEGPEYGGKELSREPDERRLLGLERDMQSALRAAIEQLEPGLRVADGGAERSVASGFIDITACDAEGATVVIELKTGTAKRDAVGQILSYMGDVVVEEPNRTVRGILVAGDFDSKARAAALMVPTLSLRRYSVEFRFESAD